LTLKHAGERIRLEKRGGDSFFVKHPDFALFLLRFGRADGKVVEVFHGLDWYTHKRFAGPTNFDYPKEWEAYVGHYRSNSPWLSNFRIALRKGALALIYPDGTEEPMTLVKDNLFRVGEKAHGPERIRFDSLVNGQALRTNLSGQVYYRAFTP